jgi:Bacterial protein of unknown function (DUF885)
VTSSPTPSRAPALTAWLDDFLASYCRHRPVNATFIGLHAHDERLPDLSEHGVGDAVADAESLLARLRTLPDEDASDVETLDRALARGFLRIQRWELGSDHQRGNPSLYTGEAAFGVIGLLRRPFAPLERRLEAARHRIDAIPALLEVARPSAVGAPEAWLDRAEGECQGLLALLGDGLDRFLADAGVQAPPLRAAADRAIAAVAAFRQHLRAARGRAAREPSCGPEAFELLLREGHFLSEDAAEIARVAADQLAESEAELRTCVGALGAPTWQDALATLADRYPPVGDYYARYRECWMECRRLAREHKLLTWPDFPIRYVPRPAWVREAAPRLYFLSYHSPAPFDDLSEIEYLVTPIEPSMLPADRDRLLRATNDSVIKLNHVVHHGAIGHHVQNWYAMRAPSRIGRIAAVDCASRIALFCGGTMAEGWACYATELMDEVGFMTPLERLAVRHGRLRMAARALVDVRLHTQAWTLDQATAFYRMRVGMPEAAARAEAVKNSMFPATALMYLVGTDAIHQLRRELASRPGFTLAAFHDRLLSCGSIPVSLAAAALRAEGRPLAGGNAGEPLSPEDR